MRWSVDKILSRFGTDMTLVQDGQRRLFRGFLHHTGSKHWHNMEKVYSPLGQIPRGQYALVAPVGLELKVGDMLLCDGRRFGIRRIETILLRNSPLCCWGLCVEKGGEDTWPQ